MMINKNYLIVSGFFLVSLFFGTHASADIRSFSDDCQYRGGVSTVIPCGHSINVGDGEYIIRAWGSVSVSGVAGSVNTSGALCTNVGCNGFSFSGNSLATVNQDGASRSTFAALSYTVSSTDPGRGSTHFDLFAEVGGISSAPSGACDNDNDQEQGEQCDGNDLNKQTCESIGYSSGTLNCRSDCTFNTDNCGSLVRTCGNGVREASEQCDGGDFGGNSCQSLGYKHGTLNCRADCTWQVAGCVGGGGGGGPSGGPTGNQNPNLVLQICPSGTSAPCQQGVNVPVGTAQQVRAWYSQDGGGSWVDKTNESDWSMSNSRGNFDLLDYDFNNSCSAGYCLTGRGVRYSPVDSPYGPYSLATYQGVVTNSSACSANGEGCPPINANYSGTGAQIFFRVIDVPTPLPLPTVNLQCNGSEGPCNVIQGSSVTLSWSSSNASSCTASGDWSGSKGTSGSESSGTLALAKTYSYTLNCSGAGGFNVDIVNVIVSANPPNNPSNVNVTQPDYCSSGPGAIISWTYSDPNNNPQFAYQVQIDDNASFNAPELDSGKVQSDSNAFFSGQGTLQFNTTYRARVRVWNSFDAISGWTTSSNFKTPDFAYPQVNFTWTANGISENQSPSVNSPVQFTDQTVFQGNQNQRTWGWLFGDGTSSSQQNPAKAYSGEGTYYITLTATDSKNQSCSRTRGPINIQKPIPQWREVAPR